MTKLQILGTGCPKCRQLAEAVEQAAQKSGLKYELEKVTDIAKIAEFGAVMMPALVIDGKVKITGCVPSVEKIIKIIAE